VTGYREIAEAGNAEHLGDALGWLLESRHVAAEVVAHFWHIADGTACDCEQEGRVEAR
jgi:hypothetical protein